MKTVVYLGDFKHPWSTENYVTHALQSLGWRVVCLTARGTTFRNMKIHLLKWEPKFLLMSKREPHSAADLLNYCFDRSITTVTWQWDLFFNHHYRESLEMPPHFNVDYLFTTDGGHEQKWLELGINHHVLRQGIHEPEAMMIFNREPAFDVAFVGDPETYEGRNDMVKFLERRYAGKFICHQNTRGLNLNRALSNVKIVVGDSYPSPGYWSNRIYEMLGRGGFMLHPVTEGMDEEFTDGHHYVSYNRGDFDHLEHVIDLCLDRTDERRQIQVQGHEHVRDSITYASRVERMLAVIGLAGPQHAAKPL